MTRLEPKQRTLWRHARLATFASPSGWDIIERGALIAEGDRIVWVGQEAQLPAASPVHTEVNLNGALVTQGLIDAHTHLVYGGDRAAEFELRLSGATYEQIARAGGGIRSTVRATRSADDASLLSAAANRARVLMNEGVTTVELKSGYGRDAVHEARCLGVARRLAEQLPISVLTTSLGAHALPDEFSGRPDDYIDAVCQWLPQQHQAGLVDAVDVFCDTIGFTPAQTRRVFDAARALGLPVKLHAEQLSNQEGAALAASYGALSCDHLEHLSDTGLRAMRAAGSVAMLLPGAYYFIRETRLPPVQALRDAGVPIAIATDHNPGSSPALSLILMLNMACTLFRLTPEEAWRGVTVNAARALGLTDRGRLQVGLRADLALWDAEHPRELAYRFGHAPYLGSVHAGRPRTSVQPFIQPGTCS
ncbi:MAG: imidazolonepropionase [Betaproteobacteria bacterium]